MHKGFAFSLIVVLLVCILASMSLACGYPGGGIDGIEEGWVVSGIIDIEFTLHSEKAITGLDIYIDGEYVDTVYEATDAETGYYVWTWDTTTVPNGPHTIGAIIHAEDTRDGIIEAIEVIVLNPVDDTDTDSN